VPFPAGGGAGRRRLVPGFPFVYGKLMHSFTRCSVPGCSSIVFHGSDSCLAHHPDRASAEAAAAAVLASEGGVKDVNAAGLRLEGLDLSRKRFVGCSFMGASMKNVLFTGCTLLLCFFDGSSIESCDFSGANGQFCSFGDSDIVDSSFEGSELIHCNFDGSRIRDSTFSNSNLYDSRFIKGTIDDSAFENCDLKRVYFIPSRQSGVAFKGSNTMEAIKDLEHLYL
jgi:uncharacterized protein YjbI with pentapeptide repeats